MATRWIKWDVGFESKPEVFKMARMLGFPKSEVIVACMVVWSWADNLTEDGVIPDITGQDIDDVAKIPGFSDAMEKTGWLVLENHGCTFVGWEEHNSKSAKKRANNNRRKARWRDH